MQNLDFTQKSSAQKARDRQLWANQRGPSIPPARLAKINMMRQQAQLNYNMGMDLDNPAPPTRGGGGGGGGGRGRGASSERKKIKGFGGEQAAEKEAEDAEKREADWNERFNKPGNAAFEDRERTAKETDENNTRATEGRPSLQTERGAAEFRRRRQAELEQEQMGGAANQETLQTGRAPMQDGTISTTKGRMAFRKGRQVGSSTFAAASRGNRR
jgi:hypothetical protein